MEDKKDLKSKEGLSDFFSDLDDDDAIDGDYDEIDQMVDEVMALLENYGKFSGGIITFDTIFNYLQQKCRETAIIFRLKVNNLNNCTDMSNVVSIE